MNRSSKDGMYTIYPDGQEALRVYCDMKSGGLTLIMKKRYKKTPYKDFNKSWHEYKVGFGNVFAENYWLGLEHMHKLTKYVRTDLFVELNTVSSANVNESVFTHFSIGPEATGYNLTMLGKKDLNIGNFSSVPFITYDKTIGDENELKSFAAYFHAGWWFKKDQDFCTTCDSNEEVNTVIDVHNNLANMYHPNDRIEMYLKTSILSKNTACAKYIYTDINAFFRRLIVLRSIFFFT